MVLLKGAARAEGDRGVDGLHQHLRGRHPWARPTSATGCAIATSPRKFQGLLGRAERRPRRERRRRPRRPAGKKNAALRSTCRGDPQPAARPRQRRRRGSAGVQPAHGQRGADSCTPTTGRRAQRLACITLAFGINKEFKNAAEGQHQHDHISFLLLEKEDKPTRGANGALRRHQRAATMSTRRGARFCATRSTSGHARRTRRYSGSTSMSATSTRSSCWSIRLSDDPIVVTGSANFSEASTNDNDENMLIIRGDERVADIYFTEFNRLFNPLLLPLRGGSDRAAEPSRQRRAVPYRGRQLAEEVQAWQPEAEARRCFHAHGRLLTEQVARTSGRRAQYRSLSLPRPPPSKLVHALWRGCR